MVDITIVAVPFPAQGHLNQLLHLSLHLSSRYSFNVHFASTPSHNRQAQQRIQGWNPKSLQKIHFHDLEIPHFESPPPNPSSANKYPMHLMPAFNASINLHAPIATLLRSLSVDSRRLVVIHDPLMPFAGHQAALITNAESYRFQCVPAFNELPYLLDENSIAGPTKLSQEFLDVIQTQFEGALPEEFWEFFRRLNFKAKESGSLFNSCRAIESEFFDLLMGVPRYQGTKLYAVGPINPVTINRNGGGNHECLKWLDEQPENSVLYLSFGSTSTFSDEQIQQLAIGLKRSNQRFMWVLRDADRGDIFANGEGSAERQLPSNFEEDTKRLGIIVRGWAPQLEILAHGSTGTFMSHCGWNSCMESLSLGVSLIAWPMHSDQPRNAMMVTKYLKVGIEIRDWERHEEIVMGEEIEMIIRSMMINDEGKEIRERVKKLSEEIRAAVGDGGSSKSELDSFIAHISR